jgi:HK97 family phage portal protein
MSLFKRFEGRALPTSIDPYQVTARPYYPNYSGEIINETNAFASSAVLSSVTLLADSIACMPLELTTDVGGRIERLPTPSVLIMPNDKQTMFDFIHETMVTLAIHGCAYIYAPKGADGLPLEMRNIHPSLVEDYSDVDGYSYRINKELYRREDIRSIHWLMLPNRRRGISPLEAQRNTIGMGIAMDRFLAQFYGDGATPSSVLETDQTITPEQAVMLRENWEDAHWKRRRPAVLTGGLKWRSITTSASDNQMIEHRESIIRDIARVYRIPLHLIAGVGGNNQTYQNVESAGTAFVRYTLLPWMSRLENAISAMLPLTQKVRFNSNEFERADLMTRVRAQQVQIASGTLTPNEARAIENREPYEGGDQFVLNLPGAPMAGIEGSDQPTLGVDAMPPIGDEE